MTSVTNINYCSTCNKPLLPGKACKICSAAAKPVHACQVIEYSKLCGTTQDLFNVGTRDNPVFWCLKHFDQRRQRTGLEKKSADNAPVFAGAARKAGLTANEYCKEMFPHMFTAINKSAAAEKQIQTTKETLAKQNPLYENLN